MMKKYLILLALWAFVGQISAATQAEISKETREYLKLSTFNKSRVILETGFGSSSFVDSDQVEELVGKQILSVNLLFTTYREVDDFDQIDLNKKRWDNLAKLIPSLQEMEKVKFKEIGIDRCEDRECASQQLHGFIIEYKKEALCYANLELQHHKVYGDRSCLLQGKKGTKILVPKDAFMDSDGNVVKGLVDLQLREALSAEDILMAKLRTVTQDNRMLESGGMIEVKAYSAGKPLSLRKGKELYVEMPKLKSSENMLVWVGKWDKGELKWSSPSALENPEEPTEDSLIEKEVFEADTTTTVNVVQSTFDGIQTTKIDFGFLNDTLVEITVVRPSNTVAFRSETYNVELGTKNGLNKYQARMIKKCFDSDQAIDIKKVDFWGVSLGSQRSMIAERAIRVYSKWNEFKMPNLGWANVDRFVNLRANQSTHLEVYCKNDMSMENIMVSLMIPSSNILIAGNKTPDGNYCFSYKGCGKPYKLPIDKRAIIVMVAEMNGSSFVATKKILLGENDVEETKFIAKKKSEIKKEIMKLL